jgi:competence protein ComEA
MSRIARLLPWVVIIAFCFGTLTTPLTAIAEGPETACPAEANSPVNVNTASAEELETLPHIGPARAQAILRARARLGRFRRLSQLLQIKGIGRATLRRLRPHIVLEEPAKRPERGEATPPRRDASWQEAPATTSHASPQPDSG